MDDRDPTEIFESMYVAAAEGGTAVPWDRGGPHPLLEQWARDVDGAGRRAAVVGSGLGPDAELLAGRGFAVMGFDVAPTAVEEARRRHPGSPVEYRVADLLAPPGDWAKAFDLVVESLTVQSMPVAFHEPAIANVCRMVATGGTLLVIASARDDGEPVDGPPWPLTRGEIDSFGSYGLEPAAVELVRGDDVPPRWRAEFRRPLSA